MSGTQASLYVSSEVTLLAVHSLACSQFLQLELQDVACNNPSYPRLLDSVWSRFPHNHCDHNSLCQYWKI